jgi:hypothetical protein
LCCREGSNLRVRLLQLLQQLLLLLLHLCDELLLSCIELVPLVRPL